jgi:NADH-quinone oxidoreductase subunit C
MLTDIRNPIPTNGGDWLTKFGETWKNQATGLKQKFGDAIEELRMPPEYPTDVPIVFVKKEKIVEVLQFLKSEQGYEYNFLSDITATDEQVEPRFEVVYNLFSTTRHWRIRIKVRARDGEAVPTAVGLWPAANWAEREVYDMFGVKFAGHPDLRRILMDERWQGHPLRKDYPLRGYQVFTDPEPIESKLLEQ